jgi:hypothetical protein
MPRGTTCALIRFHDQLTLNLHTLPVDCGNVTISSTNIDEWLEEERRWEDIGFESRVAHFAAQRQGALRRCESDQTREECSFKNHATVRCRPT